LNFNASKCKVLHYGRNNKQLQYAMNDGQNTLVVQAVEEEKDLGVLFAHDLKFTKHIGAAVNKGNKSSGCNPKQTWGQLNSGIGIDGQFQFRNWN
jgi:hypothetical protein